MSGNTADNGDGRERPGAEGDLSARLKRLETQLERKRPPAAPARGAGSGTPGSGGQVGQAMRVSTEFIAGVIAGGILGYICDHLLGSKPWGMIGFLMLGFVTGIYNVMRLTGFIGAGTDKKTGKDGPKGP